MSESNSYKNTKLCLCIVMVLITSCREGYTPPWSTLDSEKNECNNMLSYTEDFQDETWFRDEAQVVNNSALDPLEKPTADLLDISDNPKESRIYQFLDSIPEGEYIFSLYLKAPPRIEGKYAIGLEFKGDKRIWNKALVNLDNSNWIRASVRLKTEGTGRLTVFPAYALIKGSTIDKVYAWGAQLERVNRDKSADLYCGRNTISGESSNAYIFIQE